MYHLPIIQCNRIPPCVKINLEAQEKDQLGEVEVTMAAQ